MTKFFWNLLERIWQNVESFLRLDKDREISQLRDQLKEARQKRQYTQATLLETMSVNTYSKVLETVNEFISNKDSDLAK